jgi:MFS family permease
MGIRAITDRLHNQTFRSLQRRNYRLYFASEAISRAGTWVQLIAEQWLVIQLGGSGLALGITTALQFTPLLLLGAYGGVLVDRWNKRTLLILTQTTAGLLALIVGVLAVTGLIEIWMIWAAALLLGCVEAIDTPASQAFTMELAGPADATNAVALNSAVSTAARAIGPAIGGFLIAAAGIGPSFLINAATFAVVVTALRLMDPADLYIEPPAPRQRGQVQEGLRHVWSHSGLRTVLLVVTLVSIFAFNFQVLLPLLASETFHRGAALYGLLMSCLGIGAVVGSLTAAGWDAPTVRRVAALSITFGATLAAVAVAPSLLLAMAATGVMGFASSLFLTSSSGFLLTTAAEQMRGRVMALYSIAFLGTAPIGGPAVGWIAERLGPSAGFLAGALACVVAGSLVFLMQSKSPTGETTSANDGV